MPRWGHIFCAKAHTGHFLMPLGCGLCPSAVSVTLQTVLHMCSSLHRTSPTTKCLANAVRVLANPFVGKFLSRPFWGSLLVVARP
jgi:hypothetical protein